MPSRNYRVVLLHEATGPITHMARSEGNESIVAREPVVTPAGVRWVPVLSGNALRHRAIREPGSRWLVDEYGLGGKLTLPTLNFLFHGGALTEGGGREDTARIAAMQRLWPLLRLVGGSLPDQILAGSLLCGRGTLACEENRAKLADVLGGEGLLPPRLRPAESFVGGYQYTRGDARKSLGDLMRPEARAASGLGAESGSDAASNLMIFAGQAVSRGAAFLQELHLPHVSEVELGALLHSLALWQSKGGTVGGMSARGHGGLATAVVTCEADGDGGTPDLASAVAAYVAHARGVASEAVAWLEAAFAPRGGGGGGGAANANANANAARGRKRAAVPAPDPDPSPAGEGE